MPVKKAPDWSPSKKRPQINDKVVNALEVTINSVDNQQIAAMERLHVGKGQKHPDYDDLIRARTYLHELIAWWRRK